MQITKINLSTLCDYLEVSEILSRHEHAGIIVDEINHPEYGNITLFQGDNGGFIFK